jgi:hypothetical protein
MYRLLTDAGMPKLSLGLQAAATKLNITKQRPQANQPWSQNPGLNSFTLAVLGASD